MCAQSLKHQVNPCCCAQASAATSAASNTDHLGQTSLQVRSFQGSQPTRHATSKFEESDPLTRQSVEFASARPSWNVIPVAYCLPGSGCPKRIQSTHRLKLGGVGVREAQLGPCKLHDGELHAQADAQVRHLLRARIVRRRDLSLHPPAAKAACAHRTEAMDCMPQASPCLHCAPPRSCHCLPGCQSRLRSR